MSSEPRSSSSLYLGNSEKKSVSYWNKDLSQWDLTDFDMEYVKHHPSATKAEAHDSLAKEIKYMKKSNATNKFVLDKLGSLKRKLAKSKSDKANKYFWKNCKEAVCTSAVDERVASYKAEVGVSRCLALAIEKRAKELKLAYPKRAHDAVEAYSDDENSDAGSMSSGEYRSRRPKKQQGNQKKGVKPVTRTIALTDSDAKWKIEGVNWSEQLLKVRVESEKKAKKGLNLPDFRELSLNYVFLFSKIMNQSVTRRFGSESHESVWGSLPLINKLTLSAKAASWTKKMLNMATTATPKPNLRDFKKATSKWMVEACDDDDDELLVFGDLLHRSVPRLLSATISETVEDTFVYNTVSDMLNVVFGEDQKLLHEWVNKKLPDTEANITMKPDFVAATKPAKRTVYLFSVEIKPSRRTSDDDICEDRVKLGNQMKTMMQTLESFHIENAQTIGLLIQGYDCTLYLMDNVYKPIYRMIEMYSFSLPKTIEEISVLEHAVECLLSCKAVVERNANEVEKHFTFE